MMSMLATADANALHYITLRLVVSTLGVGRLANLCAPRETEITDRYDKMPNGLEPKRLRRGA